jgi:hypothetical protein
MRFTSVKFNSFFVEPCYMLEFYNRFMLLEYFSFLLE